MPSEWTVDKQRRRAVREMDLAQKQIERGKIGVVYMHDHRETLPADADKHCVLFLRATAPALIDAMTVLASWGFTYKSCVAVLLGDGKQHELVLVGTRGKIPAPAPGTQVASVLDGADSVYAMIERYFPNMPTFIGDDRRIVSPPH
jgi:hypothetical protein